MFQRIFWQPQWRRQGRDQMPRSDDRYTPWRAVLFGVVGIGSFWGGISVTASAVSVGEFIGAIVCFVVTAFCFAACYSLWLIGRRRSKKRRFIWGVITVIAIIADLGIMLPWTNERWKLDRPPDVTLCFVMYQHPEVIILDPSDKSVERAVFVPGLFDLDASDPNRPLDTPKAFFQLISPHEALYPYDVFGNATAPALKTGDRIVGVVTIECPFCARKHLFYVSLIWGQNGGWFSEIRNPMTTEIPMLSLSNPSQPQLLSAPLALEIAKVPQDERIPIRNQLAFVSAAKTIDLFECTKGPPK